MQNKMLLLLLFFDARWCRYLFIIIAQRPHFKPFFFIKYNIPMLYKYLCVCVYICSRVNMINVSANNLFLIFAHRNITKHCPSRTYKFTDIYKYMLSGKFKACMNVCTCVCVSDWFAK